MEYINIHTHSYTGNGIEIVNYDTETTNEFFSYGIHPRSKQGTEYKLDLITQTNCLAIGEIGLDKYSELTLNKQIELFNLQVYRDTHINKPIIIHCVKHFNELITLKRKNKHQNQWIIHGFRNTKITHILLNEGFYLSIGTAVLWDKKLQETVRERPLSHLFLETDTDTENSIYDVYQQISLLKNISLEELKKEIYKNFKCIFTPWKIG